MRYKNSRIKQNNRTRSKNSFCYRSITLIESLISISKNELFLCFHVSKLNMSIDDLPVFMSIHFSF